MTNEKPTDPNLLYLLAWLTETDGPGWRPCAEQPRGTISAERNGERVEMGCRFNSGSPIYVVNEAPTRIDVPPFRAVRRKE